MFHGESFDEYVVARAPALTRFGYLLTRDSGTAQDLVQEALGRLYAHWSRISRDGNPDAYVRRSMVNQLLSWRRRRVPDETPVASLPETTSASVDVAGGLAARDEMWQLLGLLPVRQRAVLVLRFYEDLSDVDIAALLGCSAVTVRSHASKALARLRDELHLQRQGVEP
jgi:RNA polymerase sigma-70 factor (sigma-E family)